MSVVLIRFRAFATRALRLKITIFARSVKLKVSTLTTLCSRSEKLTRASTRSCVSITTMPLLMLSQSSLCKNLSQLLSSQATGKTKMPGRTFAIKVASSKNLLAISTRSNQVSYSPRLGLTVTVERLLGPKMSLSTKQVVTKWALSGLSSAVASLKPTKSTLGRSVSKPLIALASTLPTSVCKLATTSDSATRSGAISKSLLPKPSKKRLSKKSLSIKAHLSKRLSNLCLSQKTWSLKYRSLSQRRKKRKSKSNPKLKSLLS